MKKILILLILVWLGTFISVEAQEERDEYSEIFDAVSKIGINIEEVKWLNDSTFFEAPRFNHSYPHVSTSKKLDEMFTKDFNYYKFSNRDYIYVKVVLGEDGVIKNVEQLYPQKEANIQNIIEEMKKITLIPAKINDKPVPCIGILRSFFNTNTNPQWSAKIPLGGVYWLPTI